MSTLGAIASGIWLAVLGEWGAVALGLGLIVWGQIPFSLLWVPMGLGVTWVAERSVDSPQLRERLVLAGMLYTYSALSLWCLAILYVFLSWATPASALPLAIWAYEAATCEPAHAAQREERAGNGEATWEATIVTSVALLLAIGSAALLGNLTVTAIAMVFLPVMGLGAAMNFLKARTLMRRDAAVQRLEELLEVQPEIG